MDVYIQQKGSKVKKEKNHFVVINNESKNMIAPNKIKNIVIEENVSITTNAIKLALENNIGIYISDSYGNLFGRVWKIGFERTSEIRNKQLVVFKSKYGNIIGRNWIIDKINSQKKHLKKLYRRKNIDFSLEEKKINKIIEDIENINIEEKNYSNKIMGYEGIVSSLYYSRIGKLLPEEIKFKGRVNEGAKDIYNIVLNYSFGILYKKINHFLIVGGMDPKIGIFHTNIKNKDALLYDYIEPYRFLAWEVVFNVFSRKIFKKSYYDIKEEKLTFEGRKLILNKMYEKLNNPIKINDKKYPYKEVIKKNIVSLVKDLLENEIYSNLWYIKGEI